MAKMIDDKSVNTTLCTSPEAAHRMFTDVKGGSTTIRTDKLGGSLAEVQVIHACSGEEMCTLSLNDAPGVETSVAHIRREVATQVQAPFFSVKLLAGGEILSDFETWENTQRLKLLQVIKTPVHDNDTDALFTAIRSDNVWKVRALLIAGQCPNALYDGFPPLVYSCIFGKSEVVGQTLLEGGSDVHVVGEGLSALEASVLAGYTRLSEEIVEAGADPHTVNGRGATCLHGAAAFGRLGCARVLLAAGADALQEDMEGDTPFSVCRESAAVRALLMDASWPRLTMKHIFVKNMEEYANYLQPSELQSLWMCCSAFKKQSVFFTDISSALFDVQGGALAETDVDITSALSGELLLRARLAPEQQSENLSHIVRSAASSFFALPHFCVEVCCRAFDSWLDLGSPSSVSIVIKPPTLEYTEDLIAAIQASDAAEVFRVLKAGQNPNCVLLDAPLTWAVELGRLSIVKALIQGNADVNFVPIGRHGPLHGAAMHDRPGEAAMLLAHGANPNLTDHQGNNPLHYALLHSLTTFHVLLSSGAHALQENRDKNTAFSMVPAGELTFLCLCFCYDNVHPRHVLHRHLHLLADLCCTKSLLAASSAFSKQRVALDVDVLGGSTAQVPNAFQINVHNYLLGSARMADSGRAWRQLAEFMKRVSPVMGTIKRYPYLFWILPVPFDGRQTVDEWRVRLTAACFFIRTLHNQNFVKLEAAMIAWFWPEIAKDLSLLDVVSTRQLAVSSPAPEAEDVLELAAREDLKKEEDERARETAVDDHDVDLNLAEEITDETWLKLRKRRLLPGALTSDEDFQTLFDGLLDGNRVFQHQAGEALENEDTILRLVQVHRTTVQTRVPDFSEHMNRLSTGAVALHSLRSVNMSFREHALLLWIIEGERYLRFHDGDCWMLHPTGAFQRYKGIPPDSGRVQSFLLELEGLFRRLPEEVERDPKKLVDAVESMWRADGDDVMREACGMPPRDVRGNINRIAAVINIDNEEPMEDDDAQWQRISEGLVERLLSERRIDITKPMLQRMKFKDAPNVNKEQLIESMLSNNIVILSMPRGKTSDVFVPGLKAKVKLSSLISHMDRSSCPILKESYALSAFAKYVRGNPMRADNAQILADVHKSLSAAKARAGRPDETTKAKKEEHADKRQKMMTHETLCLGLLDKLSAPELVSSQRTQESMSADDICQSSEDFIAKSTGFRVRIREKKHMTVLQMIRSLASNQEILMPTGSPLEAAGNCILAAIAWFGDAKRIVQAISEEEARDFRRRSYAEGAKLGHVELVPCMDAEKMASGNYLLHSEGTGTPHCVAVRWDDGSQGNDPCVVCDTDCEYTIDRMSLLQAVASGVDGSTCVFFRVHEEGQGEDLDKLGPAATASLLSLEAAGHKRPATSSVRKKPAAAPAVCPTPVVQTVPVSVSVHGSPSEDVVEVASDDSGCAGTESDASSADTINEVAELKWVEDEGVVVVDTLLLQDLEREVSDALRQVKFKKGSCGFACPCCPWRCFQSPSRVVQHLETYHVKKNQFCCSGTKQVKVILSLHDSDMIAGDRKGMYLKRSAALLREQVQPALSHSMNAVDKQIRLVLDSTGPSFVNCKRLGQDLHVRRVGNIFYTHNFAEQLFQELLLHHAKVKSIWPRFMLDAVRHGSALANLLPSHTSRWWPLVEDVFESARCKALRSSIDAECVANKEYISISIDGTFRICLTILGQKPFNVKKKLREEAAFKDSESIRRVITVRGRTGAVVAMFAAHGEGSDDIAQGLTEHLSKDALLQVRFVATDAPSHRLHHVLSGVLPNLEALMLDPVHLAMHYESASARDDDQLGQDAWGNFFDGNNVGNASAYEQTLHEQIVRGTMPASKARRLLNGVNSIKVWESQITFVECLAAISAAYRAEVTRKTEEGKHVYDLLWQAAQPDRLGRVGAGLWQQQEWSNWARQSVQKAILPVEED
ncbi:Poly [ADP-ribose] polymerase tankyrase-2 (ADP-ribosyltransferase diphtheria toxin-like 6) (ARTD6) (Poly [ADP-ribose] polymerase 5B) (Protein poly-ADP-ribosyltransferase tankyrase-2) (TNKS-2) (TRF1-interacting ankyrin-related ADP-ribose polymerase 2) (Tankyrase II) (Tankyrase-2) (TANK2) (Tankyrase-like protein) (Tankyrase-related protein) [Durusdinium trenchii]|uniref:Uncharacterized protein n=1 Tax=Durusdinium trenchii TaxID=1381693 RepID=A0ABP0JHJ7_9DINO